MWRKCTTDIVKSESSPDMAAIVFKCGRASEHDAKTSHYHLPGNDTWTWTWDGMGWYLDGANFFGHKGAEPSGLFTCWKMPRLLWLTVRRNLAHAFCILNASSERRRLLINSSAGRYKFVWLIATGNGDGNGNSDGHGSGKPGRRIPRNTLSAAIKRAVVQGSDLMYDFFQIISTWLWLSLISMVISPDTS